MKSPINKKIDDALFDFYLNIDKNSASELILEDISDIQKYSTQKRRLEFLLKAQIRKKHNEELLSLAKHLEEAINKNIEKPISYLKASHQNSFSAVFFRNLESLSKDDIVLMIKENNLVELLEKLEKDGKVD
jgi:hypothetical protein